MNKTILLISLLIAINAVTLDLETIRSEMLTRHNYYRAQHQVNDLTRVAAIEAIAQNYSNYLASINSLSHSSNYYLGSKLGENLYYGPKYSTIGINTVDAWYEEVINYDFNNPGYKSGIGHFTQVVWKGSQQLGCGIGCNSNNYCFVTCNYYPGGNILSQFASNVFPKVEDSTSSDTTSSDTTSPDTTDPDSPLEAFRIQVTERHNYYRAQHQVGNLERDSELERIAQAAAEHMIEIDNFYYTTETYNGQYIGKNLFWRYGSFTGNDVVDSWYNQISAYDFNNPGYTNGAGSFTQLVWKNSQKVGCGYACSGDECYGCCTYYPGGNYLNSFPSNVFPKTS